MKKPLKISLHVIGFLLVLSFMLYLIPPVRVWVNGNFQAQFFEFASPAYECIFPGEEIISVVYTPDECLERDGELVAGTFSGDLGTETTVLNTNDFGDTVAATLDRELLNSDLLLETTNTTPSIFETSFVPVFEEFRGAASELIVDGEVVVDVDTLDGYAAFKELVLGGIGTIEENTPDMVEPSEIYNQLIELLGLTLPISPSVDAILKQCITDHLISRFGLPDAIVDGEILVDYSDETSIGFAALKAQIEAALDETLNGGSIPPTGPNADLELEQLIARLGLFTPVDDDLLTILKKCLEDRINELFPVGTTDGSDPNIGGFISEGKVIIDLSNPDSEEFQAFKAAIEAILDSLLANPDPANGVNNEQVLQELIEILGLVQPLEAETFAVLKKCVDEKIGMLFPDIVIINGEEINIAVEAGRNRAKELILRGIQGALFNPDFIELIKTILEVGQGSTALDALIEGCLQVIYDFIGAKLAGEGPFYPWDPENPWGPDGPPAWPPTGDPPPWWPPFWPWPPHDPPPTGDPPPPPEDPLICPQCPIKYLWDTAAYHDAGVPIHENEDTPYFFVGSDIVIYPSMTWKRIEEPIMWLGNEAGGVDGQLTPNAADTDNLAIDANGILVGQSSRQSLTIQVHHITGDTFNAGELGTLIVSRYKKVGPQQYEFFVIDAMTILRNGPHIINVNNNPSRTRDDLLDGEGVLRVIYMEPTESSNLFANEDIENFWDGRRSTLWDIINFAGDEPIDLHGEIEDWWYGDDCAGNFIIVDTRHIPSCNQRQTVEVLNEPNTAGGLNITFVCEQSQSQTCGTPVNPNNGAGNFGGGGSSATNNQSFADASVALAERFKAGDPNDAKFRLEIMYEQTLNILSVLQNNPTP